jgi:hypothetical protein
LALTVSGEAAISMLVVRRYILEVEIFASDWIKGVISRDDVLLMLIDRVFFEKSKIFEVVWRTKNLIELGPHVLISTMSWLEINASDAYRSPKQEFRSRRGVDFLRTQDLGLWLASHNPTPNATESGVKVPQNFSASFIYARFAEPLIRRTSSRSRAQQVSNVIPMRASTMERRPKHARG